MSTFRSPASVTGAILGVQDLLGKHLSKNPSSANKVDSLVVLHMANQSEHRNIRDFIFNASETKTDTLKWKSEFSPEHITINDRQILTNKKVAKVSKAIHGAFNSAVILAEPSNTSLNTQYFTPEKELAVKEKIKTAFNEIDGLSTNRLTKQDLMNQVEHGLLTVTNDQKLTRSLITTVENEIANDKMNKTQSKSLQFEKSSQLSSTDENENTLS